MDSIVNGLTIKAVVIYHAQQPMADNSVLGLDYVDGEVPSIDTVRPVFPAVFTASFSGTSSRQLKEVHPHGKDDFM